MKKAHRFFLAAALVVRFVGSNGQESSFSISTGYAVPAGKQILRQEYTVPFFGTTNTGASTHYRAVSAAYGTGLSVGISYTRMFSKHFGIEFNGSYQSGTSQVNWLFPDFASALETNAASAYYSEGQSTSYSDGYSLSPIGIFRFDHTGNIQPYAKAGVIIGRMSRVSNSTEKNTDTSSKISSVTEISHFSNGSILGFRCGMGATFSLNSRTSLFAELLYTSTTFQGETSGITEYRVNGVDQMNAFLGIDTNEKNEGSDRAKAIDPMNSTISGTMSLNIGIQFRLGSSVK